MLIRNAVMLDGSRVDVRITDAYIAEIGDLEPLNSEDSLDLKGGVILPGLHDHHIHMAASAAQRNSVQCGPPHVHTYEDLSAALQSHKSGWLRGIGFHESVTDGILPDAMMLDSLISDRPVRIQHRSGRMWLLNSLAIETLLAHNPAPTGLIRENGRFVGHLFEEDEWLQKTLKSSPPDFHSLSLELASYGVTGVTDMSPRNTVLMGTHFQAQIETGRLLQSIILAGPVELEARYGDAWQLGPFKLHLHEAALPDFDETLYLIKAARKKGRSIAVHCVSEVELVFTLALLDEAGCQTEDRIEHLSVASPELVSRMVDLGLHVCVQPHFIAERGDRYLLEVEDRHQADLYRLKSVRDAGILLAGGSDAPYGSTDPWRAMRAAVHRQTESGIVMGKEEALTPEEALELYCTDPMDFTKQRTVSVGDRADLCLLDRPWQEARTILDSHMVMATIASGNLIYNRVN